MGGQCECESLRNVHSVGETEYGDRYRDHAMEQYKLFIEGMEKNSDRRRSALQFFITANYALFVLVGLSVQLGNPNTKVASRSLIALAGITISVLFYYLFKSHKQLSGGKFRVIEQMEETLPFKPYSCEWEVLKRGKDKGIYFSFSKLEALLPVLFGAGYLAFGTLSWYAHLQS